LTDVSHVILSHNLVVQLLHVTKLPYTTAHVTTATNHKQTWILVTLMMTTFLQVVQFY